MSEASDIIKSMFRWLILIKMNDHSGANLGGYFAINLPHGAILTYFEAQTTSLLSLDEKESIVALSPRV